MAKMFADANWPNQLQNIQDMADEAEKKAAGSRYNSGKVRLDLIPVDAKQAIAEVYGRGALKYADRNWEKGLDWMACAASLERHLDAWKAGEDYDPETGCLHTAMAAWNAIALLTFQLRDVGVDTRPEIPRVKPSAIATEIKGTKLPEFWPVLPKREEE